MNTKATKKVQVLLLTGLSLAFLATIALAVHPRPAGATSVNGSDHQAFYRSEETAIQGNAAHNMLVSAVITTYLPIIYRSRPPTPTPAPTPKPTPVRTLYFDDFSKSNSGWVEDGNKNCYFSYSRGRYKFKLKRHKVECWSPGPKKTLIKYGEFSVKAFGEGTNRDLTYGIYINGKGGAEQYLLLVRPNSKKCGKNEGRYEFYRTKSGKRKKKLSGCHSAVKRGSAINILSIRHSKNGLVSIYANGTRLGVYKDKSQLKGRGTGLYGKSGRNYDVVKFDDFTILKP